MFTHDARLSGKPGSSTTWSGMPASAVMGAMKVRITINKKQRDVVNGCVLMFIEGPSRWNESAVARRSFGKRVGRPAGGSDSDLPVGRVGRNQNARLFVGNKGNSLISTERLRGMMHIHIGTNRR